MTRPLALFPALRAGDTGSAVKLLQTRLGRLDVDGVFGPATGARVRAAQAHLHCAVDGIAGAQTMLALGIPVQLGIDVSHHNGRIDWPQVRQAEVFWAAIKATEGVDWVDKRWTQNAVEASEQDIRVRPYHFATPGTGPLDAEREAEHLFSTVFDLGDRLGSGIGAAAAVERMLRDAVLDIEPTKTQMTPAQLVDWTLRFGREYQRLSGSLPLLYTYSSFLRTKLAGGQALVDEGYLLWISRVGGASKVDPGPIGAFATWDVWQWSWNGRVPGIQRDTDLNWVLPSISLQRPLVLPSDPQAPCGEDI